MQFVNKKKFLQDLPDWVLNSYTLDWCLQIFLANHGPAIYIPHTTAVYRIHDQGVWSKLDAFEVGEKSKILRNCYRKIS